jgi:acetyl-CoA carboxylase carboxyl transferase subunit alpha
MKRTVLEFERPIHELEQKMEELRRFGQTNEVDVTQGLQVLEEKIAQTRRQIYENLSPWQNVQLARHPERPYALDYIGYMCTDFIELRGDRRYANDKAIIGGFAKLDQRPVMVIGQQKGRDVKENVQRNFGMCHPEGYRKALRLMQLAEKARVPIVCFIDTPGAYPGIASEERHVGEAIAVNLREMFALTVPIVCVVIGEGGSGGALGIGIGNRVLVMAHAYYSVITPEGCAAILWKTQAASEGGVTPVAQAAAALKLTAPDLQRLGLIDGIIAEPRGGANQQREEALKLVKEAIVAQLDELREKSPAELKRERYEKFRRMGAFLEA